jgi:mono/diheme cytochrome c family protein
MTLADAAVTIMRTTISTSLLAALFALSAAACGKASPAGSDKSEPPIGGSGSSTANSGDGTSAAATAKAKEIFAQRCTPCHGPSGLGDGPASASLNPHPRNFHDKEWQKSVTDDHIMTIIKVGGAAVGKSPAMPSNPDLVNDPATVSALKDVIRSFGS